jgi:hypothetical protein
MKMRKFFISMIMACAIMGFAGLAAAQDDVYFETDGDTAVITDGETHVITDGDSTLIFDNDGNAVLIEE